MRRRGQRRTAAQARTQSIPQKFTTPLHDAPPEQIASLNAPGSAQLFYSWAMSIECQQMNSGSAGLRSAHALPRPSHPRHIRRRHKKARSDRLEAIVLARKRRAAQRAKKVGRQRFAPEPAVYLRARWLRPLRLRHLSVKRLEIIGDVAHEHGRRDALDRTIGISPLRKRAANGAMRLVPFERFRRSCARSDAVPRANGVRVSRVRAARRQSTRPHRLAMAISPTILLAVSSRRRPAWSEHRPGNRRARPDHRIARAGQGLCVSTRRWNAGSSGSPSGRPSGKGTQSPRGGFVFSMCGRTRPMTTVAMPWDSIMWASAHTARVQKGQTGHKRTASMVSCLRRPTTAWTVPPIVDGSVEPITE